jgi:hypothetical protein
MLIKNVYILYPAGYSGSYVNWAINISDANLQIDTVKDPLNQSVSTTFGGVGTTHHHVRVPTHQSYPEHINWVVYNRPATPRIYLINIQDGSGEFEIASILNQDPTGVFIRIHDNNDTLINSYGFINCVTKWPTYFMASTAHRLEQLTFDPFNCSKDRIARSVFFEYLTTRSSHPVDRKMLERYLAGSAAWFYQRNKYQPHEVNESTYITNISVTDRIFELSCLDVASVEFLNIFENIMIQSQISDNFDLSYVTQFHNNYIKAQPNLEWITSIKKWQQSGNLDDYLISHSVVEACLIREIYRNLKLDKLIDSNNAWPVFYCLIKDSTWPECKNEWDFNKLSNVIQTEIVNQFNYTPKPILKATVLELMLKLHNTWQSKSIQEINIMYQEIIKNNG